MESISGAVVATRSVFIIQHNRSGPRDSAAAVDAHVEGIDQIMTFYYRRRPVGP
ncbi:hypothetical protein ARSEF1564_002567 [Beauveria bassiana]